MAWALVGWRASAALFQRQLGSHVRAGCCTENPKSSGWPLPVTQLQCAPACGSHGPGLVHTSLGIALTAIAVRRPLLAMGCFLEDATAPWGHYMFSAASFRCSMHCASQFNLELSLLCSCRRPLLFFSRFLCRTNCFPAVDSKFCFVILEDCHKHM